MDGFSKLVHLMETLRSEKGCPWDRKQTTKAFKTFLLEEVYEVIYAIDNDDHKALKEELGDLLFHIVFISQICKENDLFNIDDVVNFVYDKMYNRHPHVFLNSPQDKPIEIKWEDIKKDEIEDYSLLSNIPDIIPALLRAYIISRRVAKVGFDWDNIDDIYEKMLEEVEELKKAENSGDTDAIREEIGDLLFTIVNISKFYNIDPEDALRFTSNKFIRRFNYIETNTDIKSSSLSAMDKLWNEIKNIEKKGD
ncbi:MAG: nucleoside triphosphate pyrophosphohydrolase [Proteobacteria bacterium]|nr:nucleoside triphosphate pyrophosphohydrolase [Pseudomonadota bacterium]